MAAPTVKVGDEIPTAEFSLIAYTPELEDLVSHFVTIIKKLLGKGTETFFLDDSAFVVSVSLYIRKHRHASSHKPSISSYQTQHQ